MIAFGLGIASRNSALDIIETFFPQPVVNPRDDLARELSDLCGLEPGDSGYRTLDAKGLEAFHAAARNAHLYEQSSVRRRGCGTATSRCCFVFPTRNRRRLRCPRHS